MHMRIDMRMHMWSSDGGTCRRVGPCVAQLGGVRGEGCNPTRALQFAWQLELEIPPPTPTHPTLKWALVLFFSRLAPNPGPRPEIMMAVRLYRNGDVIQSL